MLGILGDDSIDLSRSKSSYDRFVRYLNFKLSLYGCSTLIVFSFDLNFICLILKKIQQKQNAHLHRKTICLHYLRLSKSYIWVLMKLLGDDV